MNIGDVLKVKGTTVETIGAGEKLDAALGKLNEKRIGALMVTDDSGAIAGIVSERDFLRVCSKCAPDLVVKDLMTPKEKISSLTPKDSLQTAMKIFTEKRIRHLPVLENDELKGMLSIGDAVKALLDAVEQENKYLKEYIMGQDI